MLVKIDKERIINTDHIAIIAPDDNDPNVWLIAFAGLPLDSGNRLSSTIETTPAVVDYLSLILDISDLFTEEQVSMSLSSRIAILLSNSANRLTIMQIANAFPNTPIYELEVSVNQLLAKNIIHSELHNGTAWYSHAANAISYELAESIDNDLLSS